MSLLLMTIFDILFQIYNYWWRDIPSFATPIPWFVKYKLKVIYLSCFQTSLSLGKPKFPEK